MLDLHVLKAILKAVDVYRFEPQSSHWSDVTEKALTMVMKETKGSANPDPIRKQLTHIFRYNLYFS